MNSAALKFESAKKKSAKKQPGDDSAEGELTKGKASSDAKAEG